MSQKKPSFSLIGPGRAGLAVTRRLLEAGYTLRSVIGRSTASLERARSFLGMVAPATSDLHAAQGSPIILLAVSDTDLHPVSCQLHQLGITGENSLLIHFSGLHTADWILDGAPSGCKALSLHPLMTFPTPEAGYQGLQGAPVAVEGSDEALLLQGEALAKELGGTPFRIETEAKVLYHASAVMACNYAVTLAGTSRNLMATCGMDRKQAWELLLPLMERTWENLKTMTPEEALTGPIARNDVTTIQHHLEHLTDPFKSLYRKLGQATLDLVPNVSKELRRILAEETEATSEKSQGEKRHRT